MQRADDPRAIAVQDFECRGVFAAAIALSLAPLAACSDGDGAATLQVSPDSQSTSVGSIKVQNAFVLTQPKLVSDFRDAGERAKGDRPEHDEGDQPPAKPRLLGRGLDVFRG